MRFALASQCHPHASVDAIRAISRCVGLGHRGGAGRSFRAKQQLNFHIELRPLCFSHRVSQKRFHELTSRFPPLAPTGCCSPTSSVLSRRYDALQLSRRTSFPSLGGTSAFTRFIRSLVDECTAKAWSWSVSYTHLTLPTKA